MSPNPSSRFVTAGRTLALLAGGILLATGCAEPPPQPHPSPPAQAPSNPVQLEPRTQLIPTYPCSSCHRDFAPNPNRRKLVDFHVVRNQELDHGDRNLWCYQCHSSRNIDRLVTASGALVTFDQADRLCSSCHGDKGRDWRAGIHGLTQGYWRGPRRKKLCTHCHDPHNPWFPTLKPLPPPAPPRGVSTPEPTAPRSEHAEDTT